MKFSEDIFGDLNSFLIMGVINLTPDSFYVRSRCSSLEETITLAEEMVNEGADFLDIGAESSRPGSKGVSEREELRRLLPVVSELVGRIKIPISIDTWKPKVAEKVLEAGAKVINDITGLSRHSEMAKVVSSFNAGLVIMHMQGTPETMQDDPHYEDVVKEISDFLAERVAIAESVGVSKNNIAVDPGIGFGKTLEHNLEIFHRFNRFLELGKPIMLGISRKAFIGQILDLSEENRLEGSLSAMVIGRSKGASIFRTHDVKETVRALKIADAVLASGKET